MEDFTQTLQTVFANAESRLLKHMTPATSGPNATPAQPPPPSKDADTMDYHSKKMWYALKNYKKRT